ncbi:MAG: membrane protein insertion efficiency factor YidD [Kiritimatiellales bacterium]|nr:membrane protein insertion efficiency factor YidD [Kiritimatiellales bacterium]MCF7863407.1 membrane protein insertion efficiency factor YidD [Kiritimatiellales bacterium]
MVKKNIPTTLFVGMFFFSAYSFADRLGLAEDLFKNGEWSLCQRECRRAQLEQTEPAIRFRLLDAMSSVRNGMTPADTAPAFRSILQNCADRQVAAIASYELGRLQWQLDQPKDAFDSFATAFLSTTNKALFLHASCSLHLLMKEKPELKSGCEALISQINTSRDQWNAALFSQCGKPDSKQSAAEAPGWFIGFYRNQISPAIGARCSLQPSCSEYFVQARAKHGPLAVPMIADRLCREPEVNNLKLNPVVMSDGQIRYRDSVENHDFWMKK